MGSVLVQPVQRDVGPPPETPPLEPVTLTSRSGLRLAGWFARGELSRGGVLLMHAVRADRRMMLGRAAFLYAAGYSVLLFDFQSHGESEGEAVTFGHLEAQDAAAAVAWMRERLPGEPLAAIGVSLGGAASLLDPGPLDVDALVLEAVYADIHRAVASRLGMRFGAPGAWATPLLTMQLRPRLGIDADDLRPVDRIRDLRCPVLIVAGEVDRHTMLSQSMDLHRAAPEPKSLWIVPGAAHGDLHAHAPREYEQRVLAFLDVHLDRRP
ncbi:MAG: alpha/beta hydrolase [Planctomycetota bacterium]